MFFNFKKNATRENEENYTILLVREVQTYLKYLKSRCYVVQVVSEDNLKKRPVL